MDTPLVKILLIEDDEDDYLLIGCLLAKIKGTRFELEWVADSKNAARALQHGNFDVCLLDYRLGPHNGLDLLREAIAMHCQAPIIMITGQQDREVDLEAMKSGAADYLVKGQIDAPILERSIRYATERKKVEQALRQSEMKLRSVTQFARDAIISADNAGHIISWNTGAELIFGYKEEEVLGQSLRMLTPARSRDTDRPTLQSALGGGRSDLIGKTIELCGRRRDGGEFPLELSFSTWASEEGTFYSGIIRDITNRKQAEEAFQRKTVLLQLLQEVTVAANEASSIPGALQICLDRVCARTGWPLGHALILTQDRGRELVSTTLWHVEDPERYGQFQKLTAARRFAPDTGLPGRVLSTRKPEWILDLHNDPNFLGRLGSGQSELKAGFAVPVLVGKNPVAVLEFFCEKALEPDHQLLEVMIHISAQLGRVFERMQAKETLYKAYDELEMRVRERTEDLAKANADLQAQINERNRAEEAFRESQEQFRATFEQAAVGIAHVGTQGHWLRVNQKLCDIVGYSRQELLDRTSHDLTHPDDLETDLHQLRQFLGGELKTYGMEKRYIHRSGSHLWVNLTMSLVSGSSGAPKYFIYVVEDITERKRSDLALSHLAAIVESSGDAITGTTLDGTILSWNSGAEQIYGYSAYEVKGCSISILVPPDLPRAEAEIREKIAFGEKVYYETEQIRKDRHRIHVSLSLSPINDGAGQVIGASRIARDITQRKRAEAQLTASLKEKEVLLKEIHHRVKNNLQIISSLLNLQSHYIEDPRALEMFRESQDRLKSMALIHEMLYQSKEIAKIEFNEYVRNLLSMVYRSHRPTSKAIKLDVQVDPVFLSMDIAVPVSLILNEMVSNSLKHAFKERNAGLVEIRFKKEENGRFLLVVSDDGVGLPRDFSLESTPSLGLRLVKILTAQLRGNLTFRSQVGTELRVDFGEA
jgi:PAS domain S-box-containing protein